MNVYCHGDVFTTTNACLSCMCSGTKQNRAVVHSDTYTVSCLCDFHAEGNLEARIEYLSEESAVSFYEFMMLDDEDECPNHKVGVLCGWCI